MADKDDSPEQEHAPALRVIDRRWWAKGDTGEAAEAPSLKPTYVEELERLVGK